MILKYDLNGDNVWKKTFGGSDNETLKVVLPTTTGYILMGRSFSTDISEIINKGNSDAIIVKISK